MASPEQMNDNHPNNKAALGQKRTRKKYPISDTAVAGSLVALAAAGALAIGGSVVMNVNNYNSIVSPVKKESPYIEVSQVSSISKDWARSLANQRPSVIPKDDKWNVQDNSSPQHPIDPSMCSEMKEVPATVTSTFKAGSDSMSVHVQAYGAGQAADQFYAYKNMLESCSNVKEVKTSNGKAIIFDDGFLITMGDGMVGGFGFKDSKVRDGAVKFYEEKMFSTLKDTQCRDLSVVQGASSRSPFYGEDKYKGLFDKARMSTSVPVNDVPKPKEVKLTSIKDKDISQPESPIPSSYPKMPDKEVKKPEVPAAIPVQKADDFDQYASFEIPDDNGPGCGWEWSAQHALNYDRPALSQKADAEKQKVQSEVDRTAQKYVDDQKAWRDKIEQLTPAINSWNTYSTKVNNVHDKWNYLNTERAKIEGAWNEYISRYEDWFTFDDRQAAASDRYDAALKKCVDQQDKVSEWEEKWGEKYAQQDAIINSATVEKEIEEDGETRKERVFDPDKLSDEQKKIIAEDIPDRPEDCTELPEKPSILTQSRPKEPKAPSIPSDVTIPESWRSVDDVIKENQ